MPIEPPDYRRIAADIERRIDEGELQSGAKLPTIAEIARQYETGVTTVKDALIWLEAREKITRRQGRGIYIA